VTDIHEQQHHNGPSRYTWLIGVGVVFVIAVSVYWTEISDFAHIISRMH
jgi:hypothetical protein